MIKELEGRGERWLCDFLDPRVSIVPHGRTGYHRVQIRCDYPKDLTPGERKRLMREVKEKGCRRRCTREFSRGVSLIDRDVVRKVVKVIKSEGVHEVDLRGDR